MNTLLSFSDIGHKKQQEACLPICVLWRDKKVSFPIEEGGRERERERDMVNDDSVT
ncbi:hypothetical protein BofuT4_P128060.1 [Botrytis cinerea T4]|uniref:Uncharacterized protein n=1 Tax=Botryotinia fuckeliana (strain T4) TaxID=999810 RepID=G2YR58_BOTF4|nr:hypothetical protein BofuT4_P128060.1 [Botrytis cinerea T4]